MKMNRPGLPIGACQREGRAMNAPFVTTTSTPVEVDVDPRLALLHRAAARLILVEAGLLDLDEAVDGLIGPCPCARETVAMWERKYPPRRQWRRRS